MHSEWSKTNLMQNSTCEWCTTLILWTIVYLHMTNRCFKSEDCILSGSILKNFYFQEYFSMHSEWSKTHLMQNSTCEWCTTLIFWPIVYLNTTNHCPKSQGCTPSGNISKIFYFPQYFPMHWEWSKTDFKKNSTSEWCTTLNYWPIIYLHMTNHCPKSQGCTPSGRNLKHFYFLQFFPMHSEWSKTNLMQSSTC